MFFYKNISLITILGVFLYLCSHVLYRCSKNSKLRGVIFEWCHINKDFLTQGRP